MRGFEAAAVLSEAPLPEDSAEKPRLSPRSRKGWWHAGPWRWLARIAIALALFVLATAVVTLLLLQSPAGQRAVQSLAERVGSSLSEGSLRLGSFRYELWAGKLDAAAVRLTMEGTTVQLAELHVRWSPRKGLHLQLLRPEVVLRDTGKPKPQKAATGMAAQPWSVLERAARLDLVAGRVEMQDVHGTPYVLLRRLDATMQESKGRHPIELTLQDGAVGAPGRAQLQPISGKGQLEPSGGSLLIHALHLQAKDSTLDLRGSLDRLEPNEGTLWLRADANAAVAAAFSPGTDVSGRIRAEVDLSAKQTMSGRLSIAAPALSVQGLGPWDGSIRGHFDSAHLVVESGEVLGYGGRFTATGPVALDGRSRTDLLLRAEGFDLAALGKAAAKTTVPIRSRLSANLRWTTTGLDANQAKGSGGISLVPSPEPVGRKGGPAAGVPLAGSTRVVVQGRQLRLRDLQLGAHDVLLLADLSVSPTMALDGRYRAEIPLASLAALASDVGAKSKPPALLGRLAAEGEIAGPAKDPVATVRLTGEGIATAAAARTATASIEGNARYAQGRLAVDPLLARSSAGGQAVFRGGVPLGAGGGAWDLVGEVQSLDLAPVLASSGIGGRGPLNGRVQVGGPRARPVARADLDGRITLAAGKQPLQVSLSASSDGTRVTLEKLQAALAGGTVQATATFDSRSGAIEAKATATNLQLAQLPALPPSMQALAGTLGASLALSGTTEAPVGEISGSVTQTTFQGNPVPGLTLAVHSDGRRLDLTAATVADPAHPDTPSVFLRGDGNLEGDWPTRLVIDTAALPLQTVLDAVPAARQQAAALTAQGTLTIDLPLRAPGQVRYASDGLRANGRVRELEFSAQPFRIEGGAEEATVAGLRLTASSQVPPPLPTPGREIVTAGAQPPRAQEQTRGTRSAEGDGVRTRTVTASGTLAVDGRVAIAPGQRFDLTVAGGLDLATLQPLTTGGRVAGRADLNLRVRGTPAEPDLQGELSVKDARGRVGALRASAVQLLTRFTGAQAQVERLEAAVFGGRVAGNGTLPLRRLAPGSPARFHFEMTDVDISRLSTPGSQRDPDSPTFLVSLVGDLEAGAPTAEALRGRGRLTRLEQQSPEGRIALQSPAEWTVAGGRFVQSPLRLVGPLGTLEARADARIAGGPPAGTAVVAGPFDLRMISPFLEDTSVAGPARIDLRASWDPKGVRVDGALTVENGRFALDQLAFSLSQVKGQVLLLGDRATVDATAAAGDGRLVVSGGMTFGPRLLGPAQLRIEAQRIPLNYPEGFRARATGTIRLAGDPGSYRITGNVGLTQAYYTADFDQKKQSLDLLQTQLAALEGGQSVSESLPIRIQIQLVDPLRIRNSMAQLDVAGALTATGTLAQPAAGGQVTLLEGGEIKIQRADVRIQQGRIELNGYPEGNPQVDVTALSQVGGVEMDITARGTIDDLQLQVSSPNRPDLTREDLISLLLTGRTVETAAAQGTTVVTEQLAAALGGQLQKRVPELLLVDVGSDRSLLNDDVDPTQRFNVGTRLQQNLIVLYSNRLDGTDQRWILEWNPGGGRLRLRALDDQRQGMIYEASHRFSFNILPRGRTARPEPREEAKLTAFRITGDAPIPPDQLMKAAGLKVGHRYTALRREQAADKVRKRLVKDGWWSATVDVASQPVPGHPGQIEVALDVNAGPEILISWTGDDPGEKIRKKARSSWPAYASPEAAGAVVARTAHALLEADKYYESKVDYEVRQHDGQAELALRVTRGPKGKDVVVAFAGNTVLDNDTLGDVLPKPGSLEFFEALEGRINRVSAEVRVRYAQAGYLRTRVGRPRSSYDAATGRLVVTIPIRELGPSRVTELALPSEAKNAGAQGPQLELRQGRPFDLNSYIADRDAIAAWYRSQGWMEARVRGMLKPAGEDVEVFYEVDPGPRPIAGSVRIASRGRSNPQLIRDSVVVQPGAPIRPEELSASRARLSELGIFRSVDVRPVPKQYVERAIRAAQAAAEGVPPEPSGAPPPTPGERADATPEAGPRSAGGGAAARVADGAQPGAGGGRDGTVAGAGGRAEDGVSDIVVSYVERPDVDLEYGLRYNRSGSVGVGGAPSTPDNGRLQLAGALQLSNPFGWGWRVRPYAFLTTSRNTWGVTLESNTLFGWRTRTQLLVENDAENGNAVSALASRVRGFSVQQTRTLLEDTAAQSWRDRLRVQWGYSNKEIQYFDLGGGLTPLAGRRAYLNLSLIGDERDSLTDPHKGVFWTATSELSRTALGSDVDYVRLYGQFYVYLPLPGRIVWAQGYRAGVVPGQDPTLLLENRFQAGGPTTIRGYSQDDLGPKLPANSSDGSQAPIAIGGQGVVIFNQELRFPIWNLPVVHWMLAGGVFWDAGNVWALSSEVGLGDLRHSVGAGLRIMFPFGPIRIEYAWNVGPKAGRSGRLVFGLGHAF